MTVDCEFLDGESCKVSSELAGLKVLTNSKACKVCLGCEKPKALNKVTAGLAVGTLVREGKYNGKDYKHLTAEITVPSKKQNCEGSDCGSPVMGPGTELSELIPKFLNGKGCACKSYAAKMDRWGVEGCEKRFDEIVEHLVGQAKGWKVPAFASRVVASRWLKQAIENAKRDWPFLWTYYGAGAKGDELKYSIRSVLRWKPDARVVVIGDKPSWYTGEFIPLPRIKKTDFHSFKDCYTKLLTACEHLDKFIWMMDDVYWIKDFTYAEASAPKYVRHVSQEKFYAWKPKNAWAKTRARAYSYLLENNLPTYDYAAHLPQPIRAKTFLEMEKNLQILKEYMNWECVYFNTYYSYMSRFYGNKFARVCKKVDSINTRYNILNHTDSQYRGAVEDFLFSSFPNKSAVES